VAVVLPGAPVRWFFRLQLWRARQPAGDAPGKGVRLRFPEDLSWDVWRVVRAGYATLSEVYSSWSMADLLEANIVISEVERAERLAQERATKERPR
jgi:hypothetical protein